MPEIGEKERNYYLFKGNTDCNSLEYPQTHTVLPSPSAQSWVPYLRKEVEARGSGSWHHPRGKKGALPKPRGPQREVWSQKETPNGCRAWV